MKIAFGWIQTHVTCWEKGDSLANYARTFLLFRPDVEGSFTRVAFDLCGCGRQLYCHRYMNFSIFPQWTLLLQPHLSNTYCVNELLPTYCLLDVSRFRLVPFPIFESAQSLPIVSTSTIDCLPQLLAQQLESILRRNVGSHTDFHVFSLLSCLPTQCDQILE